MNAEQFFNNGFGADVEKVHRKHVIELMTNFAKHYHTEQCNIANVVGRSEQLPILDRCGCDEPNEEPIKICMNCNGYVE